MPTDPGARRPLIDEASGSALKHPLSFSQERLWFIEQLEPGTPVYNVTWATRIIGPLDLHALQVALDSVVERHATLRTSYHEEGGIPFQRIQPPSSVRIEIVDLRSVPEVSRHVEMQAQLNAKIAEPFDLASGSMLRAVVIQVDEREHVLLLLTHHIASDGWSRGIINRDLSLLYNASLQGASAALADLPMQYADFARAQRETLQGERLESLLHYWTKQLQDLPRTLSLPADRDRGSRPNYASASIPVELTAALTADLKQLARTVHATPFMVLTAVWMVVLSRYAQQQDLGVGIPIAGRLHQHCEDIVGFFVNTLVLRGDLSGTPTFIECVKQIRETCLDAYDHQEVPFAKLVAELQPERHQNQTPLIQVMFSFGSMPTSHLCFDGTVTQPVPIDRGIVKFDVRLDLRETARCIQGTLDYKTELFDHWRMAQLAQHFAHLLQQFVANPEVQVHAVDVCTPAELQDLDAQLTGPLAEIAEKSLQEAFEQQAARTPTALAIRDEDRQLTYAQLNDEADHLAARLRSRGVQHDHRVGVCLHASADSVIAILGILKAGAAYVPLEPLDPSDRLANMIDDVGVRCVVTHREWVAKLLDIVPGIVALDDIVDDSAAALTAPSPSHSDPDLAYVLFTSGTTGRPKGAAIEHRSVLNYVSGFLHKLATPPPATFCWLQPLSADTSVSTLFGALLSGGCIVAVAKERRADAAYLAALIDEQQIDVLKIAPTHLQALLQAAEDARRLLPRKSLILGGEACPWSLVQQIRTLNPDLAIFNHYGPTEATVGVTMYAVPPAQDDTQHGSVPIGRPLHNVKTYVVDAHGQRCPVGIQGELWIGGVCLAREYVDDEALTSKVFTPDPFSSTPGARVYRTGDQVILQSSGDLRYLGRLDDQVKIRGFRVEPGESKAALLALPDVADAAVVSQRDGEGHAQLIGYVVPKENAALDSDSLRTALASVIPSHMIPSGFVILPSLPQSDHGKLDVRQLPKYIPSAVAPLDETETLLSDTEKKLSLIWEEILTRQPIGRDVDFFALGGHSLLALRLLSRISSDLGVRVPIRVLFERPTIAEIAQFIENGSEENGKKPSLTTTN